MSDKIKDNLCKIILAVLQITFLGVGPVYINEFKKLSEEIQTAKAQVVVSVNKLQATGKEIEKTGKTLNSSVQSIEKEFKKLKKVCRSIRL